MKNSEMQLLEWLFANHSDDMIAKDTMIDLEKIRYIHKIILSHSEDSVDLINRNKLSHYAVYRMAMESVKFQQTFKSALSDSIEVIGTLNDPVIALQSEADEQPIAFKIEADPNESVMQTLLKDYTLHASHEINPLHIHPETKQMTLYSPGEFAKAYKRISSSLAYAFNVAKLTLPLT